jgi:DNA-binding CsgD family transcriptional regulator
VSRSRGGAARSPIDVLEAAYDVRPTREAWLQSVVDRAAAVMPSNVGVTGQLVDAAAGADVECIVTSTGTRFRAEDALAFLQNIPDALRRKVYLGHGVVATIRDDLPRAGVDRQTIDALFAQLVPPKFPDPTQDFLGVLAFDAEGRGMVLSAAFGRPTKLERPTRQRWSLLGVHLAAAARLRRSLAASGRSPAAILRPDGRVEHAEEEAKSRPAREALSTRAIAIDRARGRLRRSDPDAGLEMWRGLVTGRWSLVDRFDSDGRRYVVAHVNEPVPAQMLALTLRERQIVGHVLLGHPSKLAAYALGVSPAAVSIALRSALLKLGVGNVAKLLDRLGSAVVGTEVAS